MAEVEWTNELVIRLINEYKMRPELWDAQHELYRVPTAKYEAWSELAISFECDIADLRKKLNSVFASHRREKGKVRCGGRSTWFLYKHLSFLPNHLESSHDDVTIHIPVSLCEVERLWWVCLRDIWCERPSPSLIVINESGTNKP